MKQSLQLKLGQQLTMTPQLQQAIRLLQLSTLDLKQEIHEFLESNPLLELDDDEQIHHDIPASIESKSAADTTVDNNSEEPRVESEWTESIPEELSIDSNWDDTYQSSAAVSDHNSYEGDSDFESRNAPAESIQDHLIWQLNLTHMSDRDIEIAYAIIECVQPDGYLSISPDDIWESLGTELEDLDIEEVIAVQHRLQRFDPVGVCSIDLRDCLLVQLEAFQSHPLYKSTYNLIDHYLPLLGNRDFAQLSRKTKLKDEALKEVVNLIQQLNPRPGSVIDADDTDYVIPDVTVKKRHDVWQVELNNDALPPIKINETYSAMASTAAATAEDVTYIKTSLQEAKWFMKSLQSRNETLLKVASCIVSRQIDFFELGEEAMKPMVLHDVAEEVGMHESTISRVTTQKYMHTPKGIFELKYFFSSHVNTASGGECSSTAIRAMIKKLVSDEPAKKPLSDNKLAAILADQGIQVARRTVAKYREAMNIPPSNERKRLI
ncbi:RNA polymerase factor sigma-54 [Marinomonas sp. UCMA 3892]|jgi:RNA polymerase sigma-54 factor|uniref:RNA polymerase sigma-54 factor n=1 Tax=Marinomonas polaris DSM 16579 TaxID=1122206 RepID=A0A1M5D207_9GAMM|nr:MULTISPECIES: RNA polymerase factor sigma-54 [Marinomonas]NLU99039.1 RNA polymerase factor sigma-54 [Marinomonas sp. UCMA 3892]PJE53591.1 RNA polymerase factor sigma-54 [Marinomonas sp. BSi20584]SHF60944.1 RNA polymerase, sigma 54 subunit, RpoN/SigL [Marinomonas polaris DSM 16579]|tara:strand:- start:6222 stop:7697 length:1476 start_codon:yes stop_codon:yes gene_type:complete